jgi:hypothetical protein
MLFLKKLMDIPFHRDYWFASTYSQRVDVIQDFVESNEDIRTLVIIDSRLHNDIRTIMNILMEEEQIPSYVRLVIGNPEKPLEVYEYNFNQGICNKTIYVLSKLNNMATALIKRVKPSLAIFT